MIKHFRIKNNFLLSGLFFLVTLFSVGSSLVSCSDSEKIVTQTEEKSSICRWKLDGGCF